MQPVDYSKFDLRHVFPDFLPSKFILLRIVFAVSREGAGTRTTGVIRCDQPRALDLGARTGRRLETVPERVMDDVLARLATIFEETGRHLSRGRLQHPRSRRPWISAVAIVVQPFSDPIVKLAHEDFLR